MQINIRDLRKIVVAIPPSAVQKKITLKLDELSKNVATLKSLYDQRRSCLAELKQSILHKAFTGELTADSKTVDRELSAAL